MWLRFLLVVPVLCRFLAAGAETPRVAEQFANVTYATAGDFELKLDASVPAGPGPHPAVIIVHGGGWVGGDRRFSVQPLFAPLEEAGFAWFSISYRLAPQHLFPAPIDDVQAAVGWVQAHAAEYRIDPRRIALVGESAGAHLAALAAQRQDVSVRGVVAFYPPTDLVDLASTSTLLPTGIRQALNDGIRGQFLKVLLAQMSPINHVRKDQPPFLVIHGTADQIVPFHQSTRLCQRMKEAGAACELIPVEGARHGFRGWTSGAARLTYTRQMIEWLRKTLV